MQLRGSIKTRAWVYILSYLGATLLVSLTILAGSYFWFATKGMRNDLDSVATEMVTNRLTFENNNIKFKLDSEGRTLSGYLRDENMSAEIIDATDTVIAKYGVFQNEGELVNYDRNKPNEIYSELVTKGGEKYMTLTTPILYQGNKVGRLVLAIPMLILGHFGQISLWILLAVLVLSMVLSWPLSHELVKVVFRSVDELVSAMEKVEIENLSDKIEYYGNQNDEVGVLVKTYNKLLDRLAEGVGKQKSFISNASHELKTPLARMVSTLEVMRMDIKDKEQIKKIEEVRNELMQMSTKVEGLLLLSKYDQVGKNIKKENFSAEEVVATLIKKYKDEITKMNLKIENTVECDGKVYGDKMGFEVVMSNLLSNAIKYNRKNGTIKISIIKPNGMLKIQVADEGKGIESNYFEKIFERFSRGEKNETAVDGFGVGMSLVKQVCDRNNWRIKYYREVSMGTKVELAIEV